MQPRSNKMQPRIETAQFKKLIGMRMKMTLSDDKTAELWQEFMPRRGEVQHRLDPGYVSMQIFHDLEDRGFTPHTALEKWAAVEVSDQEEIPIGMEAYTISGGTYAVFLHKGPASMAPETFGYIFGTWLPQSKYELDSREHFEILAEGYRPDDPDAVEEIWIPIR